MKKLPLLILSMAPLFGEVSTIMPYSAYMDYTKSSNKENGFTSGIYFSSGDLNKLIESDISYTRINYKDKIPNLHQMDTTFIFNKYEKDFFYKAGAHLIFSDDTILDDGAVAILGIGRFNFNKNYKNSYGLDTYLTLYPNGEDDNNQKRTINIWQITPYYSHTKNINPKLKNQFTLKTNFIHIKEYNKKNYLSIEAQEAIFYDKWHFAIGGMYGKMKNGVRNGGFNVYNVKDEYRGIINSKIGYTKGANSFNLKFTHNIFRESDGKKNHSNSIAITFSHTFGK